MIFTKWIKAKNSKSMIINRTQYTMQYLQNILISKYNKSATIAFSIDTDSINPSVCIYSYYY